MKVHRLWVVWREREREKGVVWRGREREKGERRNKNRERRCVWCGYVFFFPKP